MWDRFEFVYTPKHGSWLNMAEIELNVMIGQRLNRRIGAIDKVRIKARPASTLWRKNSSCSRAWRCCWRLLTIFDAALSRSKLEVIASAYTKSVATFASTSSMIGVGRVSILRAFRAARSSTRG